LKFYLKTFLIEFIRLKGIVERKKIPGKISAYLFCFDKNLFGILKANKAIDTSVEDNLKHFFKV